MARLKFSRAVARGASSLGLAILVTAVLAGTALGAPSDSTSVVSTANIDPTAYFNLNDGNLVVRATPYAAVFDYVNSGYNSGAWNGMGINSSAAAASGGKTALGVVSNDNGGSPLWASGAALGPEFDLPDLSALTINDTIVKYTYYGDADLTGAVDLTDLVKLAQNYGGTAKSWYQGDFSYDGVVDLTDLVRLAGNYGQSGLSGGEPVGLGAVSAVPEPSSFVLLGLAALGFGGFLLRRKV